MLGRGGLEKDGDLLCLADWSMLRQYSDLEFESKFTMIKTKACHRICDFIAYPPPLSIFTKLNLHRPRQKDA